MHMWSQFTQDVEIGGSRSEAGPVQKLHKTQPEK
jgi:hypothetical protein